MINSQEQVHYWAGAGATKRKHPANPVIAAFAQPKLAYILQHIILPDRPHLLDVGCGNGYFTYYLDQIAPTIGVDYAPAMLHLHPGQQLAQASAFELPFASRTFDLVFCSNLLHHLPEPVEAVREMERVSRRYVVISEPNRNNPAILALGLVKSEERASLRFTLSLLRTFAAEAGLTVLAGATMGFVTPNRMPGPVVKLVASLNAPNPWGAYAVLITECR
jgi:SAM-dependent methyltransferase